MAAYPDPPPVILVPESIAAQTAYQLRKNTEYMSRGPGSYCTGYIKQRNTHNTFPLGFVPVEKDPTLFFLFRAGTNNPASGSEAGKKWLSTKNRSTRRSTPRHPIDMSSTVNPPDPMPCALAAVLLLELHAHGCHMQKTLSSGKNSLYFHTQKGMK